MTAYVTSTGDMSLLSANRIMRDYISVSRKEDKNFNISNFYAQFVLPLSMTKLGYPVKPLSSMSISEIINLEQHLQTISNHNKFYSHSFNGALASQVANNGLDISQELFAKEFASLAKLTGKTPFKKGRLYYVELGESSFQYATKSPEKLNTMLSDGPQGDDETLQTYYKRCLEERLNASTLLESEKTEIRIDANKMIDFYYGQDKSCIAIIDGPKSNAFTDFIRLTHTKFLGLRSALYRLLKADQEIGMLYNQVEAALKNKDSDCLEQFENFRKTFNKKYPENSQVELMVQQRLITGVTEYCLNNFNHPGFADGYAVSSGKISPKMISVATFDNIHDLYVKQRMLRQKEEAEAKYKSDLSEIKSLLKTEISASNYFVDPNKYNGVPYAVPKDSSVLAKEETELYQQLEQLWLDGVLDLKKKDELRKVINKEYASMKSKAPKPEKPTSDQSQQPFQPQTSEAVEPIDIIEKARRRYGYYEMSESEQEDFDENLEKATKDLEAELTRKRFKKPLEEDIESEIDFDAMFEQEIIESQTEHFRRRM